MAVPQKKARLDKPGAVVGMFGYYVAVAVAVTYCFMSLLATRLAVAGDQLMFLHSTFKS